MRGLLPFLLSQLMLGFLVIDSTAQDFRNTGISVTPQGTVLIRHEANDSSYYILYSGDTLADVTRPIRLALGQTGEGILSSAVPSGNSTQFYRVGRVDLAQPLDTDSDGIDDVFELLKSGHLNPLNRSDAFLDADADGMSNWAEYRLGTDPTVLNRIPVIATGSYHTLLLKTNGNLWSWGNNDLGILGVGSTQHESSPKIVENAGPFVHVSGGDLHTLALHDANQIFGWGDADSGQLGGVGNRRQPTRLLEATGWRKVMAGAALSLALKTDGSLWGAGVMSFTPPAALLEWRQIGNDNDWTDVAVGGQYACNYFSSCPPAGCGAVTHSVGLKAGGTLWSWGENAFGQLGNNNSNGETSPVRIGNETNWVAVTAGEGHALALRSDGSLWSWGWNVFGQLGDGTTINRFIPIRVGNDSDWAVVAAGYRHTLALKVDGSLWAWGCNGSGQLGDGTLASASSPLRIGTDRDWVKVVAGAEHTVALKSDGSVWAWGNNQFGQVGDGTTDHRLSPVQIISTNE